MQKTVKNKGPIVIAAATGINLVLGILYIWSIFKNAISRSIAANGPFAWDPASLNDPYAVCCLVFAFTMIIAGKIQDKFGPKLTALAGALLGGSGFLLTSVSTSHLSWILGFGVLVGAGISFGYSATTPPALKWCAPSRAGRISGIVVGGFVLAPVCLAPLTHYLITAWGISKAMQIIGVGFLLIVGSLAFLLENPPAHYVPEDFKDRRSASQENRQRRAIFYEKDKSPHELLLSFSFWMLWLLYFIGAGTGLMMFGNFTGIATKSLGPLAYWVVAVLAIGNAAGGIIAGALSDKIGRRLTLCLTFAFQALLIILVIAASQSPPSFILIIIAWLIGFNYGANPAIFPVFAKDYWGTKNFGANYGLLFTAWGMGGFMMSKSAQFFTIHTNYPGAPFIIAAMMLLFGAGIIFSLKSTKGAKRRKLARARKKRETGPAKK